MVGEATIAFHGPTRLPSGFVRALGEDAEAGEDEEDEDDDDDVSTAATVSMAFLRSSSILS